MWDWVNTVPWAAVGIIVTVVLNILGNWRAYIVFKTKTDIVIAAIQAEAAKTKAELEAQVADTNRRLSDLAAGILTTSNDLRDFKSHVERHFVEKNEIADLRASIDKSIERMQNSLELATATMGDVRDSVLILTAKGTKPSVPPARRRPPKVS